MILLMAGVFTLMVICTQAIAKDVVLAWDPNPESNIAGYCVYYGTISGVYSTAFDVGTDALITLPNLPGGTYYIVITAKNTLGLESLPSDEYRFEVPLNDPPIAGFFDGLALNGPNPFELHASDFGNGITKLEFYAGSDLIGRVNSPSDSVSWTPPKDGNYTLTVKGFDAENTETTWAITVHIVEPAFSGMQWASDGALELTVTGAPDRMQHVEWTDDMKTWKPLLSEINTTGEMIVADLGATDQQLRYYRVISD